MSRTVYTWYDSPAGRLLLVGTGTDLNAIYLPGHKDGFPSIGADWHEDRSALATVVDQLDAYFAGTLRSFDLPLAPQGTAFQKRVWDALLEIPYGTTTTYGQIAAGIGEPSAARAVWLANGRNPIPIVIPCHRVVGSSGSLTGYGGGLPMKRWLLDHEAGLQP